MNKLLLKTIFIILSLSVFSCTQKDVSKNTTLFLTTNNGNLCSIDLATGKCNWQNIKNIEDTRSDSYFKIDNNTIIKSYENGEIIVFNKQTGAIIKKYQENESIPESPSLFMFSQYPLVYESNFIFSNLNGKVKSINANTMQPNWVYDVKNKVFVSPTSIGDKIIVNAGYNLCAVNAKNGQFITNLKFVHPLPHEPVVSDGEIFVIDENGNAFCLDQELNTKWQFEVNNYITDTQYDENANTNVTTDTNINTLTNLTAGEKLIVLGDAEHIIGIDKKTGQMKWLATIPIINWESPEDVAQVRKNLREDQDLHSILNDKVGVLKSLQIIDEEVVANTSSCIAVYDSNNGNLKRKKFLFNNEIVGAIKATNDFYYYVRKDGVLYKLDKTLKTETIVYKGIKYKPEDEYTSPYMQIE
ncbi:outer membrane protein assembly factor BamB family protein [Flavobacterium chungangense]|uniref:Outer membrane protein assembly factor BamB n=1 Tax=Flavobacterium chungangense TaxID=554283 RepID=A0A6V6Z4V3_9FLAO|nr:PQQ-binding-like beta-propeller repeat protein [Flavobacterium chungangense]CAD0006464.1 Outer membrane protein assembly factor BamB [Flavobacterium chungangense]